GGSDVFVGPGPPGLDNLNWRIGVAQQKKGWGGAPPAQAGLHRLAVLVAQEGRWQVLEDALEVVHREADLPQIFDKVTRLLRTDRGRRPLFPVEENDLAAGAGEGCSQGRRLQLVRDAPPAALR